MALISWSFAGWVFGSEVGVKPGRGILGRTIVSVQHAVRGAGLCVKKGLLLVRGAGMRTGLERTMGASMVFLLLSLVLLLFDMWVTGRTGWVRGEIGT